MAGYKTRAGLLATAVVVVLVAVMALFIAQVLGADRIGTENAYFWASLLPMPLYVYAIGATYRALQAISAGVRAGILGKLLRRVGIALLVGSLLEVFGVALLANLLGAGGPLFTYDLTPITLGILGATLHFVSRLMAEAEEARAELEEFV